jgi:hypothetical protein
MSACWSNNTVAGAKSEMRLSRTASLPQQALCTTPKHTHSTNALAAMEATLVVRPSYQATDLLGPDFTVPTSDPATHPSQPRADPAHLTKRLLKFIPRISLRQVSSADSTSEVGRSKARSKKSYNKPQHLQSRNRARVLAHQTNQAALEDTCVHRHGNVQSNTAPQELDQDEVRIPVLKLLFLKMIRSQKVPHVAGSSLRQENAVSIVPTTVAHPDVISTEDDTRPVATDPGPMIPATTVIAPPVRSQATTTSHDSTRIPSALPANLAPPIEQAPNLYSGSVQARISPTPVTSPTEFRSPVMTTAEAAQSKKNVQDRNAQTRDHEIDTVDEEIGSTKMYSPEQGIFVGKLQELPPREDLQLEWRQKIRPQLVKNLRTVIASLPQSLTRSETTIEPELIMSGSSFHGRSVVTLMPTIWIRCGSKQCRKSVQQAVADLSHVQEFPVHVTLHAPRPAGAAQAPESLSRATDHSLVDEILPVEADSSTRSIAVTNMPDHLPLPTGNSLAIRVQSLIGNQRSACGLRVQFSSSTGENYTCTLGGLVLLDNVVVGLTTAHAIFDRGSDPDVFSPEKVHDSHSTKHPGQDMRNSDPPNQSKIKFSVPASLRAANFGNFYFPSRPASAHVASSKNEDNHDFALLQLHPERSETAHNTYQTSHGYQPIDTISRDLTARAVQVVCSSEDVKPGQLIEGDCVLIDKAGYWETKKIQLETPLGKYHSRHKLAKRFF